MKTYLVLMSAGYVESSLNGVISMFYDTVETMTPEEIRSQFAKDVTECYVEFVENSIDTKPCCAELLKYNNELNFCSHCGRDLRQLQTDKVDYTDEIAYEVRFFLTSTIDGRHVDFWYDEMTALGWTLGPRGNLNNDVNKIVFIESIDEYIMGNVDLSSAIEIKVKQGE